MLLIKKLKNRIRYYNKQRYTRVLNYIKYCKNKPKYKALLYYKTEVFTPRYKEKYTHTNNWEILEMVKILNKLHFSVDIIDRKINPNFLPKDKYDLFIGNGSGNSGKYYLRYVKQLKNSINIYYAAAPDPESRNKSMRERYSYLKKRSGLDKNMRRLIKNASDTQKSMEYTNYIFIIGNKYTTKDYLKYNKKIFRMYPSTSPKIEFKPNKLIKKNANNFLYFGGNGNIVKGLDLLIEVFFGLPELNLYICAPTNEEEFNEIYKKTIEKSKNIKLQGFIEVGGKLFKEITNKCGFIILPSCSEGTATSVTTCMRAGLIPIVTQEAGIDIGNFGFIINDIKIESLKNKFKKYQKFPMKILKKELWLHIKNQKNILKKTFQKVFKKL